MDNRKPEGEMLLDIRHARILMSLLRDYGIRHVVLSSGNRHMHLVRFFEANDCFITHQVLDERSAGFFALGLAVKLREPVAVCCTSGTAASNYLTSVSEAFYQHVPLIYITADRYPQFLNQREDQMVPQENMFGSVVLKSVTLPVVESIKEDAVTRRLICEAILEATHRTPGPVHINVPINSIVKRQPEEYKIDDVHYKKITRHVLRPERASWKPAVNALKNAGRILIAYGQNYPLTADEKKTLDTFASRFNCVICTDNLSNVSGIKTVNANNLLKDEKHLKEMQKLLRPDLVITMYGNNASRMLRFVRGCNVPEHWDVTEGGEVQDPYNRLTKIFECTPMQFFKRMNVMTEDAQGDDSYYQLWKSHVQVSDPIPDKYSQKYAIGRVVTSIPSGSLLHLANSNTVRMGCSYQLPDNVEVFCNRGTNGIDGSASSFMGQVAVSGSELCFLIIGDLSFFYDMNALWNKKLKGNIRIMLVNNAGAGLLRYQGAPAITHAHDAKAEGWVKSLGFTYLSSHNQEEFDAQLDRFVSDEDTPMFFEVFT